MDLTFILTEQCNLRCKYCYQKNFVSTRMPAETAVAALEQAVARGADRLALTFFGGEPLLETEAMFEIMAAARRLEAVHGVPVTAKVPTNGLLLDESIIERAGQARLFISLSFDGIEPAQNAGRVGPDGQGSFEDAQRALRLLVASGQLFAVYSVVTPENVGHLAASRRYLWDEGARIIINALDYTADWDARAVRTLQRQYKLVGKFYRQLLKRREYFHLEPFDSRISQRTRMGDWQRCSPGISQLTVGPDGSLYGCVEYFYRRMNRLGDVYNWLDPAAVREMSRERSGQPAECNGCGVRDRCNNACACVNLRTTGRVNMPPESLCRTEQATLITVDQLAARVFKDHVPGFLLRHYSQSYHLLSGVEKLLETMEVEHGFAETAAR